MVQSVVKPVSLLDRMRDALSYPRIAGLLEIFKTILRAENKSAAFRGYSLQDGSTTFANSSRVGNARSLILSATASSSKYHQNLALAKGVPDALLLQHLAVLDEHARQHGGGMVLFMPPLLPNMEAEFLCHPQLATYLQNTKLMIGEWAHAQHLVILDAGQAERFGCGAEEFIDEHHAAATCYDKILQISWRDVLHQDGTVTLPDDGLR